MQCVRRDLIYHHLMVKQAKEDRAIQKEKLVQCEQLFKVKISILLEELTKEPSYQLRSLFFGYFSAFISCIFNYRLGVLRSPGLEAKKAST